MLADRYYCYALTIADFADRHLRGLGEHLGELSASN